MPLPLPPSPPTHAQQQQLRQTIRDAEQYLAKGLKRFEELTGVTVRAVELVRWPSGAYSPTLQLGPSASELPADYSTAPPPPPASDSAS